MANKKSTSTAKAKPVLKKINQRKTTKAVSKKTKPTQKRSSKKTSSKSFTLTKTTRNLIALLITVFIFSVFYLFYVRPYAYRWMPCYGLKSYDVCMPYGYSIHGFDISRHQGEINWDTLATHQEAGAPLHFVFMKATEGGDFKDVTFDDNLRNSRKYGFISGVYHFFSPRTSATKQAKFFIKTAKLKSGDLPPVLDVEVFGKASKQAFKDSVAMWLDIVERHYKQKPIIYTSYKFKNKYLNDSIFNTYPFWIAHYYVSAVRYTGEWQFWQHSDVGVVPGIDHKVDLNVFNGSLEELKAMRLP